MSESAVFTAHHVVTYDYRRSVGPVLGRFFASLKSRTILGARDPGGRVLVPPSEHDPDTGEATGELVEVGPGGVVTSWSWVSSPRAKHLLDQPFAWALIRLDGADTALLHAVDARAESRMATGMRVVPRWRSEPRGEILDIECFVPEVTG